MTCGLMMKTMDTLEAKPNLKVVAAVIDALRQETNAMVDAETRDLFKRLSSELRRCASNRDQN